jgi:hypothetical protein
MRLKSTLILACLLIVIAAYYFLVEQRKQETVERESRTSRRIFPYDKEGIDRFVLINPKGERIEIEKTVTGTGWKIVSPVVTDASRSMVDAILMQLLPGRKLDSFTEVGDLGDYGLDTPFATVIFYGTGRILPDTIFVGDKTPTSPSCYVSIGSCDTVLISREMTHNVVNKNLYHLRDKNFLHIESRAIDSLRIEDGDGQITISRRDGWWWIGDSPIRADKQLIDTYLNTLTLAIIYGFPGEDLSALERFGLENPKRRMVLFGGPDSIEISFGSLFEDQVHVSRTGLDKVLLLEQKVLEPFDWTMNELESSNLSFFETREVTRIVIETPGTLTSIDKGPDGWRLGDAPVKQAKVQTFLRMLQNISFESIMERGIVDQGSLPEPATLEISLEGENGFVIEHISLIRTDETEERAASLSSGTMGRIRTGTISELERLVESP